MDNYLGFIHCYNDEEHHTFGSPLEAAFFISKSIKPQIGVQYVIPTVLTAITTDEHYYDFIWSIEEECKICNSE